MRDALTILGALGVMAGVAGLFSGTEAHSVPFVLASAAALICGYAMLPDR